MTTSRRSGTDNHKVLAENKKLRSEIEKLEERVSSSEETLKAILNGEVDAVIVTVNGKDQIYTLKGADEPYRALFEQMNEGAVTLAEDRTILYCNSAFARFVELPLERVVGTVFDEYLFSESEGFLGSLINKSAKGRVKEEVRLRATTGHTLPVMLSTGPLISARLPTFFVLVTDISERIAAEDELRMANELLEQRVQMRTLELEDAKASLETLLDRMPVAVVVIEPLNGKIIFHNKEVNRQFRIPLDIDINAEDVQSIFNTYHLDGRPYLSEESPLIVALRTGKPVQNEIVEFERNDGTRGYANANAVPIRDSKGNLTSVIGMRFDITEQFVVRNKLEKSNAELQQFAYIASHDLQEPLRMVINYVGLLNKRYGEALDQQAIDYLGYINEGADRMRQLIDDLLQYSRVDSQAKPFTRVDMEVVISEVMKSLSVMITEGGAKIEVMNKMPTVWADRVQIGLVIQNLVSNAIKFTKGSPLVRISSSENPYEWIFCVEDNGIGIDPRFHEKLFQMFQRLNPRDEYPGTGIGLAIAKKIIERHEGRIWVRSEVGKGSSFYFSLPKVWEKGDGSS